jgi:hypothetical protein
MTTQTFDRSSSSQKQVASAYSWFSIVNRYSSLVIRHSSIVNPKEDMKTEFKVQSGWRDGVACLGEFNGENAICRKYCGANLRCIIESDRSVQLEIVEDLLAEDEIGDRMH